MELNRERIIRGLACCKGSYDCFTCDIYKRGCAGFREGLARDALSLIKQLTEENERLKETITQLGKNNDEIARVYPLAIKEAKADTVREMQKRIESRCIEGGVYPAFVKRVVEGVAKEMTDDHGT